MESWENKIKYMRIACNVLGFGFKEEHLNLLVQLYELVLEKGGMTAIDDIVGAEYDAKKRAEFKKKSELLDKVSVKVDKDEH